MIRPPRQKGDYRDRDFDCQEALEPSFLSQVRAHDTAFLDLAKIRRAITEDAINAGWTSQDIDGALAELARCYAMKVPPVAD